MDYFGPLGTLDALPDFTVCRYKHDAGNALAESVRPLAICYQTPCHALLVDGRLPLCNPQRFVKAV